MNMGEGNNGCHSRSCYRPLTYLMEWELFNDSNQGTRSHPFHLHINHMQVIGVKRDVLVLVG